MRRVALLGNPNTGKSTLFNALTGMRQKVGNFAGVTVERVEGRDGWRPWTALAAIVATYLFLTRTYTGTAIRAISQDRTIMPLILSLERFAGIFSDRNCLDDDGVLAALRLRPGGADES